MEIRSSFLVQFFPCSLFVGARYLCGYHLSQMQLIHFRKQWIRNAWHHSVSMTYFLLLLGPRGVLNSDIYILYSNHGEDREPCRKSTVA